MFARGRGLVALAALIVTGCREREPAVTPDAEIAVAPDAESGEDAEREGAGTGNATDEESRSTTTAGHRPVWHLGPNRLLAHRIVDGDLVVDASSAGFARYTRFDMPVRRWKLRQLVDGERAAVADRGASLELPLTDAQAAAARHLVLRLHVARSSRFTVKLNGRKPGGPAHVALAPGWQTVALRIGKGYLVPGENQIVLDSAGIDLAVSWIRVAAEQPTQKVAAGHRTQKTAAKRRTQKAAAKRRTQRAAAGHRMQTVTAAGVSVADPRSRSGYDSVTDTWILLEGAGLAWYVMVPDGARLVATVPGDTCRAQVMARAGDGTFAGGLLGGGTSEVDLSPVSGRVVRLELTARDCPIVLVGGAHVTVPGPEPAAMLDGPPPRYVILWVMDALRADRVRPFEPGARPEVPNFERLAATGVVFRQYYVQGNESQTTHASVWTSTYPAVHNVRLAGEGGSWRIPGRLAVIGELIGRAGLTPIGVTANGFVTASPGYARGFAEFRNMMREKGVVNGILFGEQVLAYAIERLDATRTTPTFLFLGTVDTHGPWIARKPWIDRYDPEPYDGPHQRFGAAAALGMRRGVMGCSKVPGARDLARLNAIYDSAVSYHDARVGDLIGALQKRGIYDQTMIILTADHGEEWFEDGRCGHGGSLRDSLVRVPLLIHYPARFPGGVVVREGAEGVDLVPTILDALGASAPDQVQGASLRPLANGRGRGWVRPSYTSQFEYAHTLRLDRWKAKVGKAGVPVVLDMANDPLERNNLAATHPIERRFLTDALSFFLHWRRVWKKRHWGVVTNLEPRAALELESSP